MGVLSDENPYSVLPQEVIVVGENNIDNIENNIDNETTVESPGLVSIIAAEPCLKCQHDKLINKARFIIMAPAILQLLASYGWFSIIAPLVGLIALVTKSKFFTILHLISAILTYICYSLSLSVTTINCIGTNIGFGIIFAIVSILFLFLFAITLRNYVTYCKLLVKKNTFECTCDKSDISSSIPTDSDIMKNEINSSIYPGQFVAQPTTNNNVAPQVPINGAQYYVMPYPQQGFNIQQQPQQPMMMPQGMYPPQPYFYQPVMFNPNMYVPQQPQQPQQPQPQSK